MEEIATKIIDLIFGAIGGLTVLIIWQFFVDRRSTVTEDIKENKELSKSNRSSLNVFEMKFLKSGNELASKMYSRIENSIKEAKAEIKEDVAKDIQIAINKHQKECKDE